jgi:DNA-binding CsgD family transcriptional regulator/tetratricopeptide (TPR) repeat protein
MPDLSLDHDFALPRDPTSPVLVGRSREQNRLRCALEEALAGRGHLVLVSGEAGIGKTSLVADLMRSTASQAVILAACCYDLTETPPYGPWIEIFRQLPWNGQPSTLSAIPFQVENQTAANRDELFVQVRETLGGRSAERPLVLVFDDLHWSDDASLDLLRFLARQVATLPILLVVTYRLEAITADHRLAALLPLVIREAQAVRIALGPLPPETIRELVCRRYRLHPHDVDRLTTDLHQRTSGNPFFVNELLRGYEETGLLQEAAGYWILDDLAPARLPLLLRQIVRNRIARLGEPAGELLAVAAVIGQEVPLALWAAVAQIDEETLLGVVERAVAARVLEENRQGQHVTFVHPLLREVLYEELLAARRRSWHRRIAEALTAEPEADADAAAFHFRLADDPREFEWLVRAGERARARHAPDIAIKDLSRALELVRGEPDSRTQAVYRGRGLARETLGDFSEARADLETALAVARVTGNRQAEWQGLLDLGFLWEGHDYAQTNAYYQQALDLARDSGEAAQLAHSLNRLGIGLVNVEQLPAGQQCIREALALFRKLGDRPGVATTLDLLAITAWAAGETAEAANLWREAVALARDLDDRQTLVASLTGLCLSRVAYGAEGFWHPLSSSETYPYAAEAARLAREINWRAGEAWAHFQIARGFAEEGKFTAALGATDRGKVIAEEIGHREWTCQAYWTLGLLHLDILATRQAGGYLEHAFTLARSLRQVYWTRITSCALAEFCIVQGDLKRAEALLNEALEFGTAPDTQATRCCWLVRAALALAQGQPTRALDIVDGKLGAVTGMRTGSVSPYVGKLRADVLATLGRVDDAESLLDHVDQDAAQLGLLRLRWRVQVALANLHRAHGHTRNAELAGARARSLIDEIAAQIPGGELRIGFRREASRRLMGGEAPATHRAAHLAGLTRREVEVLRLIAQGASNASIAEQLCLSPRTVNVHLTNLYAKLGVTSRTAAARFALLHGLG